VIKRAIEKDVTLEMTDAAHNFVVAKGSNDQYGARPLRRAVQQFVEDPLAELLLRNLFQADVPVTVDVSEDGERLVFVQAGVPADVLALSRDA
jgi:ATP-dependent Clp protease ATP-binding subunit ClpC